MLDLDSLTPDQYRARYNQLQERARARAQATPPAAAPPVIAPSSIISTASLPPEAYITLKLRRGEALHIETQAATTGASLMLWNADDPAERYNPGDTVKLQWTTRLTTGRVLFSDMGRILASIIADSGAGHDPILGPSTPTTGPHGGTARNGRDNLRNAAAKFGLNRRDLGPSLTLFAALRVDPHGRMNLAPAAPPGSFITLRAELNLLLALSNTPHPLAAAANTGPLALTRYTAPPPAADDLCRSFSEEAQRGFANTDAWFR
jgi:urea carboxylase-associated protein 2